MGPLVIFLLYILIVIIIILITLNCKVPVYHSITVSLTVGMIILVITYYIIGFNNIYGSFYALYLLVVYGTILNLIIFSIYVSCISVPKEYTNISIRSPKKYINMKIE